VIQLENNKTIEVIDDAFSYEERVNFYQFIRKSHFKTDGYDTMVYSQVYANQIYSAYSEIDLKNLGFAESAVVKDILKKYNFNHVRHCRVNLSNCSEFNRPHLDNNKFTLLYYCNLEWDLSWSGQTLFLSEDFKKVEYCSLYIPGRIIVFTGSIPHMIVSPSIYAKNNRYSLVIQFN